MQFLGWLRKAKLSHVDLHIQMDGYKPNILVMDKQRKEATGIDIVILKWQQQQEERTQKQKTSCMPFGAARAACKILSEDSF